ncbi:MAG: pyruvate formate-lyase-activating protein, partial [Bacilli bacterium]
MITGKIKQIETMGSVDGPGIRVVIFMQGCSLRCLFCHNPEMWNLDGGESYTPKDILNTVLKYKNYFGSNGGVTFSGGEPLMQPAFLKECLHLCKKAGINTCLDTAGVGPDLYTKEILSDVDIVIFDVKALNDHKYREMTNNAIDRSLTFLSICQSLDKRLWIRNVIVPGINDTKDYIASLADFIKHFKNIERVELLPYHTMGVSKYEELHLDYILGDVP